MKPNWKKPWTIPLWILSRDVYVREEGPGPESRSRFGPKGFWGWLFSSEADSFKEEPVLDQPWSQFGPGGFWKWFFAPEEFHEEPEIRLHEPRFGDQSFFRWLFAPEGMERGGETPENREGKSTERPRGEGDRE